MITCKLNCHIICEFHFHFSMTLTQNVHCLNLTKKAITSLLHDFTACSGGVYGQNCSLPCGQCLDNEQCHHINGTCMNGCGRGYQGLNCTEGQHLLVNFNIFASHMDINSLFNKIALLFIKTFMIHIILLNIILFH